MTYDQLCDQINLMYSNNNDIRQIINETGQSASIVFEALGYKDEWEFLEDE